MIYTVTFNPSLDYVVTMDEFCQGKVNRTVSEQLYPGGKGINVSLMLAALGYDSTAYGFVAGFTGEEIERMLAKSGIHTDFVHIASGTSRINVKLRAQQESEINGQGVPIGEKELAALLLRLDRLAAGDILVLAGSIPASMPDTIYQDICQQLSGRGILIAVDATGGLLQKVLAYKPFLIKPNHYELGDIFRVKLTVREDVIPYARKLQKMGAENVLVSMAEQGAVLAAADGRIYEAAAPEGKVRNSVGAGDSMVAGFLAGYLQGGDYRDALSLGLYAGSASAFADGLATKEEIEALRSRQTSRRIKEKK